MPVSPDDPTKAWETNVPTTLSVEAITNFQLLPENGGFVLVLGRRKIRFLEEFGSQTPEIEMLSASYLSHSMLKDMATVMAQAIGHFETAFGSIIVPGLNPIRDAKDKPDV